MTEYDSHRNPEDITEIIKENDETAIKVQQNVKATKNNDNQLKSNAQSNTNLTTKPKPGNRQTITPKMSNTLNTDSEGNQPNSNNNNNNQPANQNKTPSTPNQPNKQDKQFTKIQTFVINVNNLNTKF